MAEASGSSLGVRTVGPVKHPRTGLIYDAAKELPPSTKRHAHLRILDAYASTVCGIPLACLLFDPKDKEWPGNGSLCPTCAELVPPTS